MLSIYPAYVQISTMLLSQEKKKIVFEGSKF